MNKETFLTELRLKLPPHLSGWPYNIFANTLKKFGKNEFYPSDFADSIQQIESIATSFPQSQPQDTETIKIIPTPEDFLLSEAIAKKITPWAEGIRKKIFGSPEPTFNWGGAVEWIEKEAEKKYCDKVPEGLIDKIDALAGKLAKHDIQLSVKRPLLPYAKKGDEWKHNVYVNGPNLKLLERETRKVAKITGFSQQALVMFILAGIKPLAVRVSIKTTTYFHEDWPPRKEVILTVRAKDFSDRELKAIYRQLKKELTLKREIPLKEKHVRLYRLIEALGPPPKEPGLIKKYWSHALDEWEKRYPKEKKPYDWQGLRSAWKTIEKKLTYLDLMQ